MRTILASILLLGMLAISAAPRAAEDPAPDRAIRAVLDKQVADWNRRDLDGFCEGYWNSPRLVFQSAGTRHVGFEAMKKRYQSRYQGEGRAMGTLQFRDLEIEMLGGDSAFARGRWELTMPDGKTPGGLFTLVLRKFTEGWKIVHDHTSSDTP